MCLNQSLNNQMNAQQAMIQGQDYQLNSLLGGRSSSTTMKRETTLAELISKKITSLQADIDNLEALKRKLGSGAALDADIATLRAALE